MKLSRPKRAGIAIAVLATVAAAVVATGVLGPGPGSDPRASCPAPAHSIIPAEWAEENLREGSDLFDRTFSPGARRKVLAGSSPPLPYFSTGSSDVISMLEQGRLVVWKDLPAPRIHEIDWSSVEHGQYYATQLHGLVALARVASSAEALDPALEAKIASVLANWALCAGQNPDVNPRAWYEGTVVKRLATLLHVLAYMRRTGPVEGLSYEDLIYLIIVNADYLLDTPSVYSIGNHGIRQDALLAATALMLPSLPRAREMLETAERRLEEAARILFSKEGIWLEHAPGYVHYTLRLMQDVAALAEYSEDFRPKLFLSRMDASAKYLAQSLTPDHTIPWIGASGATGIANEVAKLIESRTGKTVEEHISDSAQTLQVYPGYGHAVFRGSGPHGLYMIFHAGQNLPAGKRHEDALSFILINRGRVWITEGGHESYEVTGMNAYLRSPFAHNTYVHGDDYVRFDRRPDLRASMTSATDRKFSAVGFSERFPTGASVSRTVTVQDFRTVLIHDKLAATRGEEATLWRGFLHFPADLVVQARGDVLEVTDPSTGIAMTVSLRGELEGPIRLHSGRTDPLLGWGQTKGALGPIHTAEYRLRGTRTADVLISWNELSSRPARNSSGASTPRFPN